MDTETSTSESQAVRTLAFNLYEAASEFSDSKLAVIANKLFFAIAPTALPEEPVKVKWEGWNAGRDELIACITDATCPPWIRTWCLKLPEYSALAGMVECGMYHAPMCYAHMLEKILYDGQIPENVREVLTQLKELLYSYTYSAQLNFTKLLSPTPVPVVQE